MAAPVGGFPTTPRTTRCNTENHPHIPIRHGHLGQGLLLLRVGHVRQSPRVFLGGRVLRARHPGRGAAGRLGGAARAEPRAVRGRVRPPDHQHRQGRLRRAAHVPDRVGAARVPPPLRRVQEKANAVLAVHGGRGLALVHHRRPADFLRCVRQLADPQHNLTSNSARGAVLPPFERYQPLPEVGRR